MTLSESGLIDFLKTKFPTHMGDDAAVLSPAQQRVITQDLLVEDVHFRMRYQTAESLAHKALHVNLSDLAAMGATPEFVLLGLSIPTQHADYIHAFLAAFSDACQANQVILIGGDTTRSPDKLFISVTAIGGIHEANLKYRHTAQPGDLICIAGALGEAHLGFTALEHQVSGFDDFKQRFLKPHARTREGIWFGSQPHVTAMMDLSDGLFIDLEKMMEASKQSAIINLDALQPTLDFQTTCKHLHLDPIITQLTGGEDYGLLLTIHPDHYAELAHAFQSQFDYPLHAIGCVEAGSGVRTIQNGKPVTLQLTPYHHF
jgi:thiamine-monophosphate kinase